MSRVQHFFFEEFCEDIYNTLKKKLPHGIHCNRINIDPLHERIVVDSTVLLLLTNSYNGLIIELYSWRGLSYFSDWIIVRTESNFSDPDALRRIEDHFIEICKRKNDGNHKH